MGEFELLARLRGRLPAAGPRVRLGPGDDAAVTEPGAATATSVDAVVEGVHFERSWGSLGQIGHKALASALSDLAAMGAEPGEAYVVLTVPPDLDEDGCIELLDGMLALARATGVTLAGGDITRGPALAVAATVVGHAEAPERFVSRAGARPGDALVVTGDLGAAAAGRLLLGRPELAAAVGESVAARLRARQLQPEPRLRAGIALARAGAHAMIDISDGLGGDAAHLAEASGARLEVEGPLPLAEGVVELAEAAAEDPLRLAVSGGEDYELLAALAPERLDAARAAVGRAGAALTAVGRVDEGEGVRIRRPGGGLVEARGYDQLG